MNNPAFSTKTIILAKARGFCNGVESAIAYLEKELSLRKGKLEQEEEEIFLLHELVHNEKVVESFLQRGVRIIEEPEEAILPPGRKGILVLSAHGVSSDVEKRAIATGCRIVDATCPIVRSLHEKAERFSREGKTILLLGKRGHRETEGIAGRVTEKVIILENEKEVARFLENLSPEEKHTSYGCLSQTTLDAEKVEKMKSLLEGSLPDLTINAQVCFATKERQQAVRELAENCEIILVVGSGKSSNSRRLCECAREAGRDSILIPRPEEFDVSCLLPYRTIGVTSGASAPEESLQLLLERLLHNPFFAAERAE